MNGPNLAMSNICWRPHASEQAYQLLHQFGFSGVEVAPGLLFGSEDNPRQPTDAAVRRAVLEAKRFGLDFVAMQSLHFGLGHARLFGDEAARGAFAGAIEACATLAQRLGIGVLTVGSANNRSFPSALDATSAQGMARDVLLPVADRVGRAGVKLAIEPIPADYGTNFLNTLEEALAFVRMCDHPFIRLNFDTGAMHMSGEISGMSDRFADAQLDIGHIHIGQTQLAPVSQQDAWIAPLATLVMTHDPSLWMSAEMRPDQTDELTGVRRAAAGLSLHARGGET